MSERVDYNAFLVIERVVQGLRQEAELYRSSRRAKVSAGGQRYEHWAEGLEVAMQYLAALYADASKAIEKLEDQLKQHGECQPLCVHCTQPLQADDEFVVAHLSCHEVAPDVVGT